jgi:tetratricopeptide (TPR) repeat protein
VILLVGAAGAYYWIASAQDRAEARFQAGMHKMSPGHYPEAIQEFTSAISIWNRHAQAYLQRGNAEQILGQLDAALDDFERARQVDPSLSEAYTARGTILRDRGDLKGAIQEITRSLSVRATMDGYFQRGQLWERIGEHQKAIEDYDRAIAEERDAPFVYAARSLARQAIGDESGAEQDREMSERILHKH